MFFNLPGALSPLTVNVTHVTSTLIFLEWSPGDEDATYTVVIKKQGGSVVGAEPRKLTVVGNKVFVTNLRPKTTYCLSVSAGEDPDPDSEQVCVQTALDSHSQRSA